MNFKAITAGFIIAMVFVGIIFDLWIYVRAGTEGTISWYIYNAAHDHPSIPFFAGYLCGHFFWQMKKKRIDPQPDVSKNP